MSGQSADALRAIVLSGPRNHRPDEPNADYALGINLDHLDGADQ